MGLRSAIGATLCDWFARVVALLEVLEQAGMRRLPAQELAGQRARGSYVDAEEGAEPAEVLRRDGLHRQVELPADRLGDRPERHALLGGRMQHRAGGRLPPREPRQLPCGGPV